MTPINLPVEEQQERLGLDFKETKNLQINLRYWNSATKCISEWGKPDLKGLRKALDKIQSSTFDQLKSDTGLQYKAHKGKAANGFSRPASLSKDQTLYELRTSSKSRLHGFVENDLFFLVWLDRNHEVFPERG